MKERSAEHTLTPPEFFSETHPGAQAPAENKKYPVCNFRIFKPGTSTFWLAC